MRRASGRPKPLSLLVFALCTAPALQLALAWQQARLGADPLNAALHHTGWWALALLLATLAVTPLRRVSVWVSRQVAARWGRRLADWNPLIRQRRQLGLWCFAYACLHLALFAVLDAGSLEALMQDVTERPFIAWGLATVLLLMPLAATSTQAAIRRLRQHWARLHKLAYGAALTGLVHTWLQTQPGHEPPYGFMAVGVVLLGFRVWAWLAGDRQPAEEADPTRQRPGPGR